MKKTTECVNALTGFNLIATRQPRLMEISLISRVNALTGFNLIATGLHDARIDIDIAVSMPSRASTSLLRGNKYIREDERGLQCQCPHGLQPHCYVEGDGSFAITATVVSMPSRASTSLLQYRNY